MVTPLEDRVVSPALQTGEAWANFFAVTRDLFAVKQMVNATGDNKPLVAALARGLGTYLDKHGADQGVLATVLEALNESGRDVDYMVEFLSSVEVYCPDCVETLVGALRFTRAKDTGGLPEFTRLLENSGVSDRLISAFNTSLETKAIAEQPPPPDPKPRRSEPKQNFGSSVHELVSQSSSPVEVAREMLTELNATDLPVVREVTLGVLQGLRNHAIASRPANVKDDRITAQESKATGRKLAKETLIY